MILRRGTQHGGTADIDLFNRVHELHLRSTNGILERVKVDRDEIDCVETMRV